MCESNKGELNKGWTNNHPNQEKKFINQMNHMEIKKINEEIKECKKLRYSPHLQWKVDTGQIWFNYSIISETLSSIESYKYIREFSIFKLDNKEIDNRVLFRSSKKVKANLVDEGISSCYLMFVVSINTSELVTAYYVLDTQDFNKVNYDRYDSKLNIIHQLSLIKRNEPKETGKIDGLTIDEWLGLFAV